MCKFTLLPNGDVTITPYSDKAAMAIRINGLALMGTDPVVLRANYRIAIGPNAIFLFKNKAKEEN